MKSLDDLCGRLLRGDANSIIGDLESECGTNYVDTVVTQDAPGAARNSTNNSSPHEQQRAEQQPLLCYTGGPGGTVADVAVLQEADDYLSLKNEDHGKNTGRCRLHAARACDTLAHTHIITRKKRHIRAHTSLQDEQRKWFYSQCLAMKLACPDQIRARRILISDLYCQVSCLVFLSILFSSCAHTHEMRGSQSWGANAAVEAVDKATDAGELVPRMHAVAMQLVPRMHAVAIL
eukprot:5954236-Amphidinium_carterae.1